MECHHLEAGRPVRRDRLRRLRPDLLPGPPHLQPRGPERNHLLRCCPADPPEPGARDTLSFGCVEAHQQEQASWLEAHIRSRCRQDRKPCKRPSVGTCRQTLVAGSDACLWPPRSWRHSHGTPQTANSTASPRPPWSRLASPASATRMHCGCAPRWQCHPAPDRCRLQLWQRQGS